MRTLISVEVLKHLRIINVCCEQWNKHDISHFIQLK